jgi:two-component system, sensor histidine kinase and response regulator
VVSQILVIEDQPDVRENIVELLDAEKFKTLAAENGIDGVNLAQEYHPDLILCDVMMPELDGYDVLNMLRQNPETALIPFVFLTAKAATKDMRQGMNLGADDYLTKPFTRTELLQAIRSRLSRQKAFVQQADLELTGLQQSLAYSVPDKILNPLDEIARTAEIFIQDAETLSPNDFKALSQSIYTHTQFLQRAIQNFFLYMNLEFLARNTETLTALQGTQTMRPGDFIFMISTQKAKEYKRSRDVKAITANVQLGIATDDLKKIVEESLDFALTATQEQTPVSIVAEVVQDTFQYSLQFRLETLSPEQFQRIAAKEPLDRQFYEELDPGLGLLIIHRIAELYSGGLTLDSGFDSEFTLTVSLPIQIVRQG